jgi:hypothetical protein
MQTLVYFIPSLDGRGKGRVDGYGVVTGSKDNAGILTVSFRYNPQLVEKVKTIGGRKWPPAPYVIARSEATKQSLGHKSSKTTEIYTHVSTKDFTKIRNPLD